jgi:hypothetical protein
MSGETSHKVNVELVSPPKDVLMDAARQAHANHDVDASKAIHDAKRSAVEVHGGLGSDYIKSIVFGAIDGIITEFAVGTKQTHHCIFPGPPNSHLFRAVASVAGASLPIEVVLVTGVAKLLGDGLAMGIGTDLRCY